MITERKKVEANLYSPALIIESLLMSVLTGGLNYGFEKGKWLKEVRITRDFIDYHIVT